MALVTSKRQLARDLGIDRDTLDRWLARNADFPVISRGDAGGAVWRFDSDAVRVFLAAKQDERDRQLKAKRAYLMALRDARQ